MVQRNSDKFMRTLRNFLVPLSALVLTACASSLAGIVVVHDLEVAPLAERNVWVANFRNPDGETAAFGEGRPDALRFERHLVAIPPNYQLGEIQLPTTDLDLSTQFVTRDIAHYGSAQEVVANIEESFAGDVPELGLFVHGFNTSHAAAVYGFAQLLHEYQTPFPAILFSWPSAAQVRGYVYDRDSVAISRNRLEALIQDISDSERRLMLIGHSMGTYLIMETLRQMEIRSPGSVDELVDGVILLSPDIDPEVFRDQFATFETPPSPFIVAISREDRALRASTLLTGTQDRLGSLTDPEAINDLPITVIDMTAFADGTALDHSTFATSGPAIAALRSLQSRGTLDQPSVGSTIVLGQ